MGKENQDEVTDPRELEQRTPALDDEDYGAFDEAFGQSVSGDPVDNDGDDDAGEEEAGDEAAAEESAAGEETGEDGEDEGAPAGDKAAAATGEADQGDADDKGGESGDEDASWEQVGRELAALFESDPEKITPERLKHHVKTWHGRYRSERDKRRQVEEELEQLRKQTPSSGDDGSREAGSESSREELNRRFREGYGEDLPRYVDARAREIAQELVDGTVQPIRERVQASDQKEHEQLVREAHPDADELAGSDDLWMWVDEQPPRIRDAYNEIVKTGSAADVIRMLDDYKHARGKAPRSTPTQEAPSQPRQAAGGKPKREAPRRPQSRSTSGPRRGDADPQDYDSAWDEALRRRTA